MKNNYSQLLIDVQKKSKITVENTRDIRSLKEVIDEQTGNALGYNTLRRIFGFLEKTTPTDGTLNTLSIYLGFKSFSSYKSKQKNYDSWYYQQNLQRILSSKKLNEEDLVQIQSGLINNDNTVYLAYFVSRLIQKGNIEMVDFIFKNINLQNTIPTELHKLALILSNSLLQIQENKAMSMYQKLISNDEFRNNVPLLYIDYTNLKSRYSKVLAMIAEYGDNDSDLLFVSLMNNYKKFYIDELEAATNFEIKKPIGFNNFNTVLMGRYYGCKILNSKKIKEKLKGKIIGTCSSTKTSYFLQEIVPALIIKNQFDFLEEIYILFYEDIFESDAWSSQTTISIYLIGLANVNWKKKNIKVAKMNLDLIDMNKIELSYVNYVQLFYYLTKMKISFHENVKPENKSEYVALKQIVRLTGFTKFNSEAKKYVLNKI